MKEQDDSFDREDVARSDANEGDMQGRIAVGERMPKEWPTAIRGHQHYFFGFTLLCFVPCIFELD